MPSACALSLSGRKPSGKRAGSADHAPRPESKSYGSFAPAPAYQPASTTNRSAPSAAARVISARIEASSISVP